MTIRESGEMYLETIYVLSQKTQAVRGIDVGLVEVADRVKTRPNLVAVGHAVLVGIREKLLFPDEFFKSFSLRKPDISYLACKSYRGIVVVIALKP